jgi:acetoin:2,6-dichlorophenolindophenol oxidoreductase subunit alpha
MAPAKTQSSRQTPARSSDDLQRYYRELVLLRRFNEIQVEIFRTGEIPGGLHPGIGHEAIAMGVAYGVRDSDYLNGTHRVNNSLLILRGVPLHHIWAEVLGKVTGVNRGRRGVDLMGSFDDRVRTWPQNPVLGHNAGISTGAALSLQLDHSSDVVVCGMGDGGSAAGTVWESCFFAGIRKLPIVYFVENNLVAYSTRFEDMSPTERISDRASAFGMPGRLVDGNDVVSVRDAVRKAADRARAGKGPTLLELRTYRFVGHFVGDPEVYRTREDVRAARAIDPVPRLESTLRSAGELDDAAVEAIRADADRLVYEGLEAARRDPLPSADDCLGQTYRSGVYPMGYSS